MAGFYSPSANLLVSITYKNNFNSVHRIVLNYDFSWSNLSILLNIRLIKSNFFIGDAIRLKIVCVARLNPVKRLRTE